MNRKVEDPELRCVRCDGTGHIDETYPSKETIMPEKISHYGPCPDCLGSGRKQTVDKSEPES